MFYKAFSNIPCSFSDEENHLEFEHTLASCFSYFPNNPNVRREDYSDLIRESVFLSFRKLIKKDYSVKDELDAVLKIVDEKIGEYIKIQIDNPEMFEMSEDELLNMIEVKMKKK